MSWSAKAAISRGRSIRGPTPSRRTHSARRYGRPALLEKVVQGIGTAGVLMPLWPLIANGADMSKAYPDELLSIEVYTKGKLKPGDMVDANNVDYVKDLLDPIGYHEVKNMGRKFRLVATTTEAE